MDETKFGPVPKPLNFAQILRPVLVNYGGIPMPEDFHPKLQKSRHPTAGYVQSCPT